MPATNDTLPLHRLEFDEPGPPCRTALHDGTPVWRFTRYDDVRRLLVDARFARISLPGSSSVLDDPEFLAKQDGAAHRRLRRTVQGAFTPRAIARMEPLVAEAADRLLDDLIRQGSPADLVTRYTQPFPITVTSTLLGVQDLDHDRLLHWNEYCFALTTGSTQESSLAHHELTEFTARLLAERRRTPGDDLISHLIRSADHQGGIPDAPLVKLISTLVIGGYDTTMTMLGNALLYCLSERPQDWERLGSDEKAAGALTERLIHLIPLNDPEKLTNLLRATEDIEIGGAKVRTGELVIADRAAANRDPAVFPGGPCADPFAPLQQPTLAFGVGQHYCPGTWLARTELRIALSHLASRLPGLRLSVPVDAITWRQSNLTRSPLSLPAAW
ncbi:cytochrome P450 [Streptomyces sp. BE147]|uniref:cytochrome P450 n=1 Tax=unclassified Streptomyces TaxID=2593676 RepID=UPI002E78D9EB|nr:cytochrome P450 [Streptomyces sp. BE147]MEE1735559.1 cytochrome P450 [Streptomyces sp. BE147]